MDGPRGGWPNVVSSHVLTIGTHWHIWGTIHAQGRAAHLFAPSPRPVRLSFGAFAEVMNYGITDATAHADFTGVYMFVPSERTRRSIVVRAVSHIEVHKEIDHPYDEAR